VLEHSGTHCRTSGPEARATSADPPTTLFHLALYGEFFGPDFEAFLNPASRTSRKLSVETRLEFVKYCVPDYACYNCQQNARNVHLSDASIDPRRAVKDTGPYSKSAENSYEQTNIALVWVLQSSRWRPHWRGTRARAGVTDFQADFEDGWWYNPDDQQEWRQRMLEAVMVCQGLEGLGMIRPGLQDEWTEKISMWKERIASLEKEPKWTKVGLQATLEYPLLLGDLRVVGTGYVCGT
jgi:hypothetical protein